MSKEDRLKAVFGSESELSDSDSEDEKINNDRRVAPRSRSTSPSSSGGSRSPSPKPVATRRRSLTPSSDSDGDGYADEEDVDGGERTRPSASAARKETNKSDKKRKRKEKEPRKRPKQQRQVTGDNGDILSGDEDRPPLEMTDAQRRRYELEKRMDAALKGGKKKRKVKKGGDEDINIDSNADDEVARIYSQMVHAVEADISLNSNRQPAVHKVRLLSKVLGIMQNVTMQQSILDSQEFLQGVRQFLEPLKDGSLPSLTIQRSIFEQLKKMDITKEILKESGLGKVIFFYTKTKKATPEITRQANLLYDKWSRLILNQGNIERPQVIQASTHEEDDSEEEMGEALRENERRHKNNRKEDRGSQLLESKVESRNDEDAKNPTRGSRLPSQIGHAYLEAPAPIKGRQNPMEEDAAEGRRREIEKFNKFKRKAALASAR